MALLTVGGKVLLADGKPVNAPSGGGVATLTINSSDYSSIGAGLYYVNSDGVFVKKHPPNNELKFPTTLYVPVGCTVTMNLAYYTGIPTADNPVGCDCSMYSGVWVIYVTEPTASLTVSDAD